MRKIERLELENQVLRNAIACALECIKIEERTTEIDDKEHLILTEIKANLDFEEKMQGAIERERAIDYRYNAKTLESCEFWFKRFEQRVILNDGMVVGFEY